MKNLKMSLCSPPITIVIMDSRTVFTFTVNTRLARLTISHRSGRCSWSPVLTAEINWLLIDSVRRTIVFNFVSTAETSRFQKRDVNPWLHKWH